MRDNVRQSPMTLTCPKCEKPGHKMKDSKELTKNLDKSSVRGEREK